MNIKDKLVHFKNKLPAWEAHVKMMPPHRNSFTWDEIQAKNPKKAAVMLLLYLKGNTLCFPLLERHIYDGSHSGEIGFPGGKKEETDLNYKETALRETAEEIGIDRNLVENIRELSELYIPPSNFLVFPYIGFYKGNPNFILDKREVKELIEVPLDDFLYATSTVDYHFKRQETTFTVPAYSIQNKKIWGATAMILSELKEILTQ